MKALGWTLNQNSPSLEGKEHFPAEWPEDVQQTFQSLLVKGVLATVQSFDGFANVLSLSLHTESGGGQLTAMILDALNAQAKKTPLPPTAQKAKQSDSNLSAAAATAAAASDCLQPEAMPETHKGLEVMPVTSGQTVTPESAPWTPQQRKNTAALTGKGWSSHISTSSRIFQFSFFTMTTYIQHKTESED